VPGALSADLRDATGPRMLRGYLPSIFSPRHHRHHGVDGVDGRAWRRSVGAWTDRGRRWTRPPDSVAGRWATLWMARGRAVGTPDRPRPPPRRRALAAL